MDPRHSANRLQTRLHPLGERLQALREAHLHRFPVRVRQHQVKQQMRKDFAGDRHLERIGVREVRLAVLRRLPALLEHHLALGTVLAAPAGNVPLQGSHLPGLVAARMALDQHLEQRLGLQRRVALELRLDPVPILGKRIRACTPTPRPLQMARQAAAPLVVAQRPHAHAGARRRQLLRHPSRAFATHQLHLTVGLHGPSVRRDHETTPANDNYRQLSIIVADPTGSSNDRHRQK